MLESLIQRQFLAADAACTDEIRQKIHDDKHRWMLAPFRAYS